MNYAVIEGSEIVRTVFASPKSIEAKRAVLKPGQQLVPCPNGITDETHEWDGESFVPKETP
jgi:hypothetical protein